MKDLYKIKFVTCTHSFVQFMKRNKEHAINLQNVINMHGRKAEIMILVKDFYEMQIETAELYKILFTDIVNDINFAPHKALLENEIQSFMNKLLA